MLHLTLPSAYFVSPIQITVLISINLTYSYVITSIEIVIVVEVLKNYLQEEYVYLNIFH